MKPKLKFLFISILLLLFIHNNSINCEDNDEEVFDEEVLENEKIDAIVESKPEFNFSKTGFENNISSSTELYYSEVEIENEDKNQGKDENDSENKDEEYEDYGGEEANESEEQSCSIDYFIDRLTPDDYGDGKNMTITKNVEHINETIKRVNHLIDYTSVAVNKMMPFIKQVGSRMSDLLFEIDLEPQCFQSVFKIIEGVRKNQLWALRFFDSMGSLVPHGILDGVFSSLGQFDECLDIESPKDLNKKQVELTIKGKYCLLKPILPLPKMGSFILGEKRQNLSNEWLESKMVKDKYINSIIEAFEYYNRTIIRIGICIPSTCSHQNIESAINQVLFPKFGIPFEVGPDCVVKNERKPLDRHQCLTFLIIAILSVIAFISTLFELHFQRPKTNHFSFCDQKQNTSFEAILTSFSLIKNTKSLLSNCDDRFVSIDTIKLLMMIWIFISNSYIWTSMYGTMGLKRIFTDGPYKILNESRYILIRLPQLVDTLFLISGLALALNFGNYTKFNYLSYVAKRLIRFTPLLIGSILFIYLTPLFGDGPLWDLSVQLLVDPCKQNILPTLFYYNNYDGNVENTCNIPSVYLSASFQLYLIGPIILIPLMKMKPNRAIVFSIFCILIGCGICTLPKLVFGLKTPYEVMDANSFQEIKNSLMQYWMGAHQHISTFSYGILVGYLIKYKPNLSFGGVFGQTLIWIFAPICTVLAIVWNEQFSFIETKTTHLHNMIWLAFGKVFWSTGFAWILYMCCTGRGGLVNRFMSLKLFRPFARLSFSFYLLSNIIVAYRLLSIKETYIMKDEFMFRGIVTDFLITNGFAYILYVLIECPVNNIMRIRSRREESIQTIDCDIKLKDNVHVNNGFNGSVDYKQNDKINMISQLN